MPADPYRRVFEGSPLPMWVFDARNLRFLAVNAAAAERYGYTRREFLAMTILDIRPSGDVQGTWRHQTKAGEVLEVDVRSSIVTFRGRKARVEIMSRQSAVVSPQSPLYDPYATLSVRERQVLALAAQGHSNQEVAAMLNIGRRTAETHRSNLMRKLGLKGEPALIRFAMRRGILDL